MPQHLPTARELDDLALMAMGALGPNPRFEGPDGLVQLRLPRSVTADVQDAGAVELIDAEGAPVARLTVEDTYDVQGPDLGVTGPVDPLPSAPARIFQRLRLSPQQAREVHGPETLTLPVDQPLTVADLQAIRTAAGERPVLLLVLMGAGVPHLVSGPGLVRATVAAAGLLPRADVVAFPLARRPDPGATAELVRQVVDAYAPGETLYPKDSVEQGPGNLPDPVAAVVARDRPTGSARGAVVFFTGLSGSGKSTLARALRDRVLEDGERTVSLLDGDVVRRNLSAGLGFSREDRETNIRRIGWVAAEIARHGGLAICSPIAPFDATRQEVRQLVDDAGADFVLVHVATPLAECERRDRKGLYARARTGEIGDFTGISSPYEEPQDAEVRVDTTGRSIDDALEDVLAHLRRRQLLDEGPQASSGTAP